MSDVKKYPAGATGRDIIDQVVVENQGRNIQAYEDARNMPPYFGAVSIGEDQMTLTTVKNKKEMRPSSILCDIFASAENMQLQDGDGVIKTLTDTVVVDKVHPAIIKLAKACVVGSYTPCEGLTNVLSDFVRQLLDNARHLCLPLPLVANTDVEKVIGQELNDYLRKLCDANDIPYGEVIVQKKGRSIGAMLAAAEGNIEK